mgnify:CR=1 FL=1
MLIACWSVKGGVGTTVVAAGLAVTTGGDPATPALLVDLAGDLPTCLGIDQPTGQGIAEWSRAGADAPPDALSRLEVPVTPALGLVPRGDGPVQAHKGGLLARVLALSGRLVVVDCGRPQEGSTAMQVAAEAHRSLLVTRLCLMGLRRATRAAVRPSGVVVVRDPGRALTARDVEACVGAPVVAEIAVDPAVARSVDAGLLVSRLPRSFGGALGSAA